MANTRTATKARIPSTSSFVDATHNPNPSMTVAFKNTAGACNRQCHKNTYTSTNVSSSLQSMPDSTEDNGDSAEANENPAGSDADDKDDLSDIGDVPALPVQRDIYSQDAASSALANTSDGVAGEQVGPKNDAVIMMQPEEGHSIAFEEARRPSVSNISGSASDVSDFDIADDDDDYGAIDQLSQASEDDAVIEASDACHLASNVDDWAAHEMELDSAQGQLLGAINWDDHRTYDFEYSLLYSDHIPHDIMMMDPTIIESFDATTDIPSSSITPMLAAETQVSNTSFDPHLGPALFADDISASDSSSVSSACSRNGQAVADVGVRSANAEPSVEDDTESEDIMEEIERRARLSQERQRLKSSRQRRTPTHKKKRSSPSLRPTHASKIQKFTRSPRRIHASPRMTARGRIVCLSVTNDTRIRWITGRVPVDPSETAPSPELVRHLRSRMFQQAYCFGSPTFDMLRGMGVSDGFNDAVFNQPSYCGPRLLPPANIHAGPQPMVTTDGQFDLSQFKDDDGDTGVTLDLDYVDLLDFEDHVASSHETWHGALDELDEVESAPAVSNVQDTSDIDMDTPCPKRQRTILDHIDDNAASKEFEVGGRLFTSPPAPNHVTV